MIISHRTLAITRVNARVTHTRTARVSTVKILKGREPLISVNIVRRARNNTLRCTAVDRRHWSRPDDASHYLEMRLELFVQIISTLVCDTPGGGLIVMQLRC